MSNISSFLSSGLVSITSAKRNLSLSLVQRLVAYFVHWLVLVRLYIGLWAFSCWKQLPVAALNDADETSETENSKAAEEVKCRVG